MKKIGRWTLALAVALSGAGLSTAASAQQQGERAQQEQQEKGQQARQQRQQQRQQQQQQGAERTRQVSGQVIRAKSVELRGTDQQHMVVLLATQQANERLIVDLGPQQNLQQIQIRPGQRLQVQGQIEQVGDRMVLFAQRVRSGQQEVAIQRMGKQQLEQAAKQGQMQERQMQERQMQQRQMEQERPMELQQKPQQEQLREEQQRQQQRQQQQGQQ